MSIKVNRIGAVSQIVLDRPERRNALGKKSVEDLAKALQSAERDPSVHAVVISGAPPAFCSGSDLRELGVMTVAEMCEHELETARVARQIAGMSKPVVAAIEGYALGGGFVLAISCDVVVSADNARWHMAEVPNGWLPPWGLQALLVRVGPINARLLTWGADAIDGVEAHRLGVVDYLSPAGKADETALALAGRLAALPVDAVQSCKRFFESYISLDGERLDRQATVIFADNCDTSVEAQATLAKFGVKK